MKYISTRGGIEPIAFQDAVMMGLATDGGLLLPERLPDVRKSLGDWRGLGYPELATRVMQLFIDDIPPADLAALVERSYETFDTAQITPVIQVGDVYVQELWHGPTLAFKDLALQFLGNLFEYILGQRQTTLNILAATSGDTGSAAIHGVRGRDGIHIFVLHPHGRVSPIQERQMTTVTDANVHNIAIEGSFDDGQRIIKELFNDLEFKAQYRLGAVNSVNFARVLAQIVYYFYGAFRVQEQTRAERVQFCVPTGNFGNVLAGYMARRLGAPIDRLVLATNENDILARFFNTGIYERGDVRPTWSPSMDIQVASNFERYLYYLLDQDAERVRGLMDRFAAGEAIEVPEVERDDAFVSAAGNNAATLATIARHAEEDDYTLDPHTAVGVHVAEQHLRDDVPTICLATAHPAKFTDAVERATGKTPTHPVIDRLEGLDSRCTILPARAGAIRGFIVDTLD